MQKFDHVLLASDFDNTLVYTQSALDNGTDIPPMCPRNREALDYFIQNGGLFAISTGRALPAFMDYAKDVPMSAPCVIANGAAIYDFRANEYLYTAFLGKAIYDHMAEVLARFPTLAFEVYHDDCRIHAMNPNRYIRNHEHLTRSPVQVVERFADIDLPIIKILFEEDFPVLDAVRTFILSRPWGREYELHLLQRASARADRRRRDQGRHDPAARVAPRRGAQGHLLHRRPQKRYPDAGGLRRALRARERHSRCTRVRRAHRLALQRRRGGRRGGVSG